MREDSILREEVSSLVDALFESRLDTEGAEQLEDLVTHNPLASRYYFENRRSLRRALPLVTKTCR